MHYIYLLYDIKNPLRFFSYEDHKLGRKIGSTCSVKTRMKPFLTNHPDKVPLECYYQILNPEKYSCYQIDKMIKNYFEKYNFKGSDGIEFYEKDKVTQETLEKFFDLMGVLWKKYFEVIDEDINSITKEDIQNIAYDIENSKFYKKEENNKNKINIEDSEECCICMEHKKEAAIVPCGHLICWENNCRNMLNEKCPLCKSKIDKIIRIYI